MRWLDGTIDSVDMNLGKFREMVRDRCSQRVRHHLMTEQQAQLPLWLILSYQCGVTECQVEKRYKRSSRRPLNRVAHLRPISSHLKIHKHGSLPQVLQQIFQYISLTSVWSWVHLCLLKRYLFIWLCWVVAVTLGIFSSCGMHLVALSHMRSEFSDQAQTCVPCIGRWILNH